MIYIILLYLVGVIFTGIFIKNVNDSEKLNYSSTWAYVFPVFYMFYFLKTKKIIKKYANLSYY